MAPEGQESILARSTAANDGVGSWVLSCRHDQTAYWKLAGTMNSQSPTIPSDGLPEARQHLHPQTALSTRIKSSDTLVYGGHSHSNHRTTGEHPITKLHARNQSIYIIDIYRTSFCAKIMRAESQRTAGPTVSFHGPPSSCEAAHKPRGAAC